MLKSRGAFTGGEVGDRDGVGGGDAGKRMTEIVEAQFGSSIAYGEQ